MNETDSLRREVKSLRERLSKLSEASLHICESLDLDILLQGVIDSARSLTEAHYGALVIFDDFGSIVTIVTSGITLEERSRLGDLPTGLGLLQHLNEIEGSLRLADISTHPRSVGFPPGHLRMKTFLGTPIRYQRQRFGNIYLTVKEGGREFQPEDEEILELFASQAAIVISNARRYTEEHRAKADLEALFDISPVGIMVFDAKTGALVSRNEEVRRIDSSMKGQSRNISEILHLVSLKDHAGQDIPLEKQPITRALTTGETVRS